MAKKTYMTATCKGIQGPVRIEIVDLDAFVHAGPDAPVNTKKKPKPLTKAAFEARKKRTMRALLAYFLKAKRNGTLRLMRRFDRVIDP